MPGSRVYVGNIRDDVRERDVEKFFKGFGGLREITLKNGFGFVEFEDDRYTFWRCSLILSCLDDEVRSS